MVSWPVTLIGSLTSPRAVVTPRGIGAASPARAAVRKTAATAAARNDLCRRFRKQPSPPLAGKKIRIDFADKIHRTGGEYHFGLSGPRDCEVDGGKRVALDVDGSMRRERTDEIFGIERVLRPGHRQHDIRHARRKHPRHPLPLLARKASENEVRLYCGIDFDADGLEERRDCELVVGAIQDDGGIAGDDVEAAGPSHSAEPRADRILADRDALGAELFDGGERDGGILVLERPGQTQFNVRERKPHTAVVDAMGGGVGAEGVVAIDKAGGASALRSYRHQGGPRLRIASPDYHGHLGLDYSALLGRDRGDGVAEVLHVIEADGRDDAQDGSDDVGGIESAAEPGLHDCDID